MRENLPLTVVIVWGFVSGWGGSFSFFFYFFFFPFLGFLDILPESNFCTNETETHVIVSLSRKFECVCSSYSSLSPQTQSSTLVVNHVDALIKPLNLLLPHFLHTHKQELKVLHLASLLSSLTMGMF